MTTQKKTSRAYGESDQRAIAAEGLRTIVASTKRRRDAFALFAQALQYPATCESLVDLEALSHAVSAPLPEFAEDIHTSCAPLNLRGIRTEYTRLFIVGDCISLYGSSYLNGPQNEAARVARIYRFMGLAKALSSNEPADFLAFEFDFLNYLCSMEINAMTAHDSRSSYEWRAQQREFWEMHVQAPAEAVAALVCERTRCRYFAVVARSLRCTTTKSLFNRL